MSKQVMKIKLKTTSPSLKHIATKIVLPKNASHQDQGDLPFMWIGNFFFNFKFSDDVDVYLCSYTYIYLHLNKATNRYIASRNHMVNK